MTEEQKAQAYNEALKRAKDALNDETISSNTIAYLQDIFPELKESEGEQSKKWILEYLYDGLRKSDEQFKDQFTAAIAWLEKQGEHANFLSKIQVGDKVTRNEGGVLVNISQLERVAKPRRVKPVDKVEPKFHEGDWDAEKKELKKIEQKLIEWSEEDEEMFDAIIADIQFTQKAHIHEVNQVVYERKIDWLKSIRQKMGG